LLLPAESWVVPAVAVAVGSVPVVGRSPVALLEAEELAWFPWPTVPVSPPWPTRTELLSFCAPDCVAVEPLCASCAFEGGGGSGTVEVGSLAGSLTGSVLDVVVVVVPLLPPLGSLPVPVAPLESLGLVPVPSLGVVPVPSLEVLLLLLWLGVVPVLLLSVVPLVSLEVVPVVLWSFWVVLVVPVPVVLSAPVLLSLVAAGGPVVGGDPDPGSVAAPAVVPLVPSPPVPEPSLALPVALLGEAS
jgi:hypothetical protein